MAKRTRVIVVGGGALGLGASIELARRGISVDLLDPGPLPHPKASSTDLSKAVRMDYGGDAFYTDLALESIAGWHDWNRQWERSLYHEVGFLLMARETLTPESYEGAGFELLTRLGQPVERMSSEDLSRRFPAWNASRFPDGYLNPRGGWAESGEVVRRLEQEARSSGVNVVTGVEVVGLEERGSRVTGVIDRPGRRFRADRVVLATGAWTPTLLPELADRMWSVGQPVLHFQPRSPDLFRGECFPVWAADISNTGWYGFPTTADGVVKVANHGPGSRVDPRGPREVEIGTEEKFREFLTETFPALAEAPCVESRLCLYCDTFDGDFWIDAHPDRPGLLVAAGGSGHAFKFAPVLGSVVADLVEKGAGSGPERFRWRDRGTARSEEARHISDAQNPYGSTT